MDVGLFFGSFNPVHIGHLAIANYLVEYTSIRQLWFVISPHNPLKEQEDLLNDFDRYDLLKKAVNEDPRFRISDVEFHMPRPSYTIDTLITLGKKYPDHRFTLLMGSDNLESLPRWKQYEEIVENYEILVYPRPGYDQTTGMNHRNISWVDAPQLTISSTFIREAIRAGRNLRHFVPPQVWDHIEKMGFYR